MRSQAKSGHLKLAAPFALVAGSDLFDLKGKVDPPLDDRYASDHARRGFAQSPPLHLGVHLGAVDICGRSADWDLFVRVILLAARAFETSR